VAENEYPPKNIFGFTRRRLEAEAKQVLPGGAGVAREIFHAAFRRGSYDPAAWGLSAQNAEAWGRGFSLGFLEAVELLSETSPETGLSTQKVLYRLSDGSTVEAVLIPMPEYGRATLCVSSQVGCRMACAFCQTGKLGLTRNLTAAEIVSEVMTARLKLDWEFRNLVFMGMGEPLDNPDAVIQAIRVLNDQEGACFDMERITVCTAAPPGGIESLAQAGFRRLNLSISLNGGTDEVRSRLMPVTKRLGLDGVRAALAAYPRRRNFVLGVNYCLVPGYNDRHEDALAVADFCRSLGRVLLNVIPYNPGPEPIAPPPSEPGIEAFIATLKAQGLPVRRRVTKGRSILAACGQLGRKP
jgi:23S rRNA (adenine2503-C2)-methyltransferase